MSLRIRISLWLVSLVVLLSIIVMIPAAKKSAIIETVDGLFDDYAEAVEAAHDDDDDDDDDHDQPIASLLVQIDDDIADYAGVETFTLVENNYSPEFKALARVVDIRPMLAVKAQHNQALATLNVAKVAERSASQELARLNDLAKGTGSVATKKVNHARAIWHEAKATSQGLQVEVQAIADDVLQTWGGQISEWLLSKNSKQWQRLLSRQDSLLLVILPSDLSLPAGVESIQIARDGQRAQSRKAYFVSPAFVNDEHIQGESYYFKTVSERLRPGMRLEAWIASGSEYLTGVFVPEKAIVWNSGQPWVYVQLEDDLYQRRAVQQGLTAAGGLFVENGLVVGEQLVVQGAQMLLSEEFRWQILDEDDD